MVVVQSSNPAFSVEVMEMLAIDCGVGVGVLCSSYFRPKREPTNVNPDIPYSFSFGMWEVLHLNFSIWLSLKKQQCHHGLWVVEQHMIDDSPVFPCLLTFVR